MIGGRLLGTAVAAALLAAPLTAFAQSPFGFSEQALDAPALIDAETIEYDRDADRIVASGKVTVVQGARALSAERIEYYPAEDPVHASGGVTLLEPGGEVVRAERAELSDRLKRAVAEKLGVRLSDGSRLVGRRVERVSWKTAPSRLARPVKTIRTRRRSGGCAPARSSTTRRNATSTTRT